ARHHRNVSPRFRAAPAPLRSRVRFPLQPSRGAWLFRSRAHNDHAQRHSRQAPYLPAGKRSRARLNRKRAISSAGRKGTLMSDPFVVIEGFHKVSDEPDKVMLRVSYGDKEAQIELPEATPLGACEPGVEA